MKHLSPAGFANAIDGRLSDADRAHLDVCRACASRVTSLRDTIGTLEDADDLREPSPLFWEQLSARVRAAVHETTPDARRWRAHPAWAIGCSIVLVVAVILGARNGRLPRVALAPAVAPAATEVAAPDDPAWTLLTDVASLVEEDNPQTATVTVRPSEVDRAVATLSNSEREELKRLLQDEMKRSGD